MLKNLSLLVSLKKRMTTYIVSDELSPFLYTRTNIVIRHRGHSTQDQQFSSINDDVKMADLSSIQAQSSNGVMRASVLHCRVRLLTWRQVANCIDKSFVSAF